MEQTSSDSTIMIRHEPKKQIQKTGRGSKYRGVSKNGKKWQVSCTIHFNRSIDRVMFEMF